MPESDFPVLDSQLLRQELEQQLAGDQVHLLYLDSCESTNLECQNLAKHQSVVIAEHQTAGRGRRGKVWHSPQSQNIYCSIGLQKNIQAELLGLISLQVGVSMAGVLQALGYHDISLKWPNDILLQGKKLGGILIETRAVTQNEFFLVIGFGLNLHLDQSQISQIDQPVISLRQVTDNPLNRHRLYKALISGVMQSVIAFESSAVLPLIEQFNLLDRFQGKAVRVKTHQQEFSGLYQGIDSSGHVRISTEQGLESFSAAEISLRVADDVAH